MSVNTCSPEHFQLACCVGVLQTAVHRAGSAAGIPSEGVQGEQAFVDGERGAAVEAP